MLQIQHKKYIDKKEYVHMHKLLSWIAVIIWMSMIFYLSHQLAAKSSELSTAGITEVTIDPIETIALQVKIEKGALHHIVRKYDHFFYYLMLGILVVNALRRSEVFGYRSILLGLLIYIFYAV